MKKKSALLAVLLLFFMLTFTTVYADVVWVPEDDFLNHYIDESVSVDGRYIAAGANGEINIYMSPDDGTVVDTVQNGDDLYVSWQWNEWFCNDIGWIHSDDVSKLYDSNDFFDDNVTFDFEGEETSIPNAQLYTYPNSGESYELVEDSQYAYIGGSFSSIYTDENGLDWGYIGYYMQNEGWVCIDDPTNTELASGAMPIEQSVSQLRGNNAKVAAPTDYFTILLVATVLVFAVIGVTCFLLLRKKKAR